MIRPTAAILWIPLCLWHLILYQNVIWKVLKLFAERGYVSCNMLSNILLVEFPFQYVQCITASFIYPLNAMNIICYFLFIFRFIVLSISSLVDRVFYGRWVNVHYNFLDTNVFSNIGSFYGTHPWHWYLTQGFPILLGAHIFPFIAAVRQNLEKTCSAIIFWTVFAYR